MSVCCAYPNTVTRPAAAVRGCGGGRHRRADSASARADRALDLVARLGATVSLCALLVLAGATTALVTGAAPADIPTITVTFDHAGR